MARFTSGIRPCLSVIVLGLLWGCLGPTRASPGEYLLDREITGDSVKQTKAAILADHGIQTLVLNSAGGEVGPAIELGVFLVQHQLNTEVRGSCRSACTLVFAAGIQRIIHRSDWHPLGYHGPSADGSPVESPIILSYLRALGLPEDFIRHTMGNPIWYPDQSELLRNHVVTDIR